MVNDPATRDRWLQTILSSKHARITMTCEQGHGQQMQPCRQSSMAAQRISRKLLLSSKRLVWTSEWGEQGRFYELVLFRSVFTDKCPRLLTFFSKWIICTVPEHILQNCPTHTLERTRLRKSGADFRDKLWGTKEEPWTTAQFIKNIHLQIWYDHTSIWTQHQKSRRICTVKNETPSYIPTNVNTFSRQWFTDVQFEWVRADYVYTIELCKLCPCK